MAAQQVGQTLVFGYKLPVGRKLRSGNYQGKALLLVFLATTLSACIATGPAPSRRAPRDSYSTSEASYPTASSSSRRYGSNDAERLRQVMVPLFQGMDHPCRLDQVRIGIINQAAINAANAGNCQFYITAGLLRRANDDQLRGVLAHEIAHEDLGHVAKAQVLGAGLNILAAGLQQLFPAAGALAPVAGELVARGYGRSEEFAADRHGVDILRRAGYSKETMVDALTWIRRVSGDSGGGFLSTHPGLDDRIATVQRMG
jgi:Zn-dependent protease with chaperone function